MDVGNQGAGTEHLKGTLRFKAQWPCVCGLCSSLLANMEHFQGWALTLLKVKLGAKQPFSTELEKEQKKKGKKLLFFPPVELIGRVAARLGKMEYNRLFE